MYNGRQNIHIKSADKDFQSETYSMHKGKHLVKPIMLICSDGYIIDDFGSYNAAKNNATIEELFETKKLYFDRHFKNSHVLQHRC